MWQPSHRSSHKTQGRVRAEGRGGETGGRGVAEEGNKKEMIKTSIRHGYMREGGR